MPGLYNFSSNVTVVGTDTQTLYAATGNIVYGNVSSISTPSLYQGNLSPYILPTNAQALFALFSSSPTVQFALDPNTNESTITAYAAGGGSGSFNGDLAGFPLYDSNQERVWVQASPQTAIDYNQGSALYNSQFPNAQYDIIPTYGPTYSVGVMSGNIGGVTTELLSANVRINPAPSNITSQRNTTGVLNVLQVNMTGNMVNNERVRGTNSITEIEGDTYRWGTMSNASQNSPIVAGAASRAQLVGQGSAAALVGAVATAYSSPANGSANVQYATAVMGFAGFNTATPGNIRLASNVEYARGFAPVISAAGQANLIINNAVGMHLTSTWASGSTIGNVYSILSEDPGAVLSHAGNLVLGGNLISSGGTFNIAGNIVAGGNITSPGTITSNVINSNTAVISGTLTANNISTSGNIQVTGNIYSNSGPVVVRAFPLSDLYNTSGTAFFYGNTRSPYASLPATYTNGVVQIDASGVVASITKANVLVNPVTSSSTNTTVSMASDAYQATLTASSTKSNNINGRTIVLEIVGNSKTLGNTTGTASQYNDDIAGFVTQARLVGTGAAGSVVAVEGISLSSPGATGTGANVSYASSFFGVPGFESVNPAVPARASTVKYARLLTGVVAMGNQANLTIQNAVGVHIPTGWATSYTAGQTQPVRYSLLVDDVDTSLTNLGSLDQFGPATFTANTLAAVPVFNRSNAVSGGDSALAVLKTMANVKIDNDGPTITYGYLGSTDTGRGRIISTAARYRTSGEHEYSVYESNDDFVTSNVLMTVNTSGVYSNNYFFANGTPYGGNGYTGSRGATGPIGYTGSIGASGALGYTGSKGATGNQGIGYDGLTSATTVSMALGAVTFNTNIPDYQTAFIPGTIIRATSGGNWMVGSIFSFSSTTMVMNVTSISASIATGPWTFTVTGVTGATGPTGATGVTGYDGSTGYTGSRGAIGYTGSLGATGATGPIGYTGSAVVGLTTNATDTVTLSSGFKFIPATNGTQDLGTSSNRFGKLYLAGQTIDLGGTILSTNTGGNLVVSDSSNNLQRIVVDSIKVGNTSPTQGVTITVDSSNNILFTSANGTILNGYTGSRGYTGSIGASGALGYTGSQGVIGYTGSLGATGATGPIGYTGSQGTQGAIGYTGSQGIQGVVGYTGSIGATGAIGYTGSFGATGATGVTGYAGSLGYTGSIGYTGSQGYTGSRGTSSSIFPYRAQTNATSGQTIHGYLLWNNATQVNATQINVDHLDSDGNDIDAILNTLDVGSTFLLQDNSASANYQSWKVNAAPTNVNPNTANSYWTYPVQLLDSGGTGTSNFANTAPLIMAIQTAGVGYTGSAGAGGTIAYFGSFDDRTATQTIANVQVAQQVRITNTLDSFGISLASNVATVSGAGTYSIIYSIQLTNTDNTDHNVNVWLTKNGADQAYSNTQFSVPGKHAGINGQTAAAVNYVVTLVAGDNVGLKWGSESTQTYIETIPAGTTPTTPVSPGVIFTMTQVTYTQAGYTGSTGASGALGYTGSIGASGAIGYTGSIGATGATGAIGYTGSLGATGATGPIGYTGSLGAVGYTGSIGASGAIGYTGSTGASGAIGYTGSQGIQGVIGYTGSQGIQGAIGYTGSTGASGALGYTGSQGDIGYTGSFGATGATGPIGYTGSLGAIGYTGSASTATGPIGYTGSLGPTGTTGPTGPIGYTGSAGSGGGGTAGLQDIFLFMGA